MNITMLFKNKAFIVCLAFSSLSFIEGKASKTTQQVSQPLPTPIQAPTTGQQLPPLSQKSFKQLLNDVKLMKKLSVLDRNNMFTNQFINWVQSNTSSDVFARALFQAGISKHFILSGNKEKDRQTLSDLEEQINRNVGLRELGLTIGKGQHGIYYQQFMKSFNQPIVTPAGQVNIAWIKGAFNPLRADGYDSMNNVKNAMAESVKQAVMSSPLPNIRNNLQFTLNSFEEGWNRVNQELITGTEKLGLSVAQSKLGYNYLQFMKSFKQPIIAPTGQVNINWILGAFKPLRLDGYDSMNKIKDAMKELIINEVTTSPLPRVRNKLTSILQEFENQFNDAKDKFEPVILTPSSLRIKTAAELMGNIVTFINNQESAIKSLISLIKKDTKKAIELQNLFAEIIQQIRSKSNYDIKTIVKEIRTAALDLIFGLNDEEQLILSQAINQAGARSLPAIEKQIVKGEPLSVPAARGATRVTPPSLEELSEELAQGGEKKTPLVKEEVAAEPTAPQYTISVALLKQINPYIEETLRNTMPQIQKMIEEKKRDDFTKHIRTLIKKVETNFNQGESLNPLYKRDMKEKIQGIIIQSFGTEITPAQQRLIEDDVNLAIFPRIPQ